MQLKIKPSVNKIVGVIKFIPAAGLLLSATQRDINNRCGNTSLLSSWNRSRDVAALAYCHLVTQQPTTFYYIVYTRLQAYCHFIHIYSSVIWQNNARLQNTVIKQCSLFVTNYSCLKITLTVYHFNWKCSFVAANEYEWIGNMQFTWMSPLTRSPFFPLPISLSPLKTLANGYIVIYSFWFWRSWWNQFRLTRYGPPTAYRPNVPLVFLPILVLMELVFFGLHAVYF